MVKEEVCIDARVHSRLIGARGRNIRKIMEQFSVDIKFPRSTDPDPHIVTVIGAEENVLDAKEHLLNLEEEYVSYFTVLLLEILISSTVPAGSHLLLSVKTASCRVVNTCVIKSFCVYPVTKFVQEWPRKCVFREKELLSQIILMKCYFTE